MGTGASTDGASLARLVGHTYRFDDYYEVGREKIREFAYAVQDGHPAHHRAESASALGYDALIAPLTFTAVLAAAVQGRLTEVFALGSGSHMLHTEQRIVAHRPTRSGDRLTCSVTLRDFRQDHGQDRLLFETAIGDHSEAPVQTVWTTAVRPSSDMVDEDIAQSAQRVMRQSIPRALSGRAAGPSASPYLRSAESETGPPFTPHSDRAFTSVTSGERLPERRVRISRGDLVNYAGVAGDPNPLHWCDKIAGLLGLPNVVAHGMLTMGLSAGWLSSWAGDPGAVREHRVRFTNPVFVDAHSPAEIAFNGRVKALDPRSSTATIAIVAESQGKRVFGGASATIQLR